jgi:hypothetical protein
MDAQLETKKITQRIQKDTDALYEEMKQLDQNPGIQKQLDEKFEKVRSDTGKR